MRTLAWVENVCTEVGGATTTSQKLVARRGNCDPVTLLELPTVGPVIDPIGVCSIYASFRNGAGGVASGSLQRTVALPDGSGIVFELTNDHSVWPATFPPLSALSPEPPLEEGFYFVRADGTGLRRFGPQAGNPILTLGGGGFRQADSPVAHVSPSGRLLATAAYGPDPTGKPTLQVFVTSIATGERTQVTHLPATEEGITGVFFGDERTIFFYDNAAQSPFMVGLDGSGPTQPPTFDGVPGATLVPRFAIAGDGAVFLSLGMEGTPKKVYPGFTQRVEVFRLKGSRVLQLTNFGYPDTFSVSPARGGALFVSSADPLRQNPNEVCQLFWIDSLAGRLRQLTHFPPDDRPKAGCTQVPGGSCTINGDIFDPRTGMVTAISSCDPFGRNPDGEQAFAMRFDGSGLRQVTSLRGREDLPGGGVRVELGGPWAYSAPLFY